MEKSKYLDYFINNYKKYLIFLNSVLSLMMSWSLFKVIVMYTHYKETTLIYSVIFSISLLFLLFNVLWLSPKQSIEKAFLLIAVPLGLCFIMVPPLSHKSDEPHHYYRVYDIAINGNLMPDRFEDGRSKIKFPIKMLESNGNAINTLGKVDQQLFNNENYSETREIASTAASYNPVTYIFSVIGMRISFLFSSNVFLSLYITRIFNFLSYLILGYLSLKLLPKGKFIVFVLLFNPMLLQQATAITGDGLVNSLSILLITYILYIKDKKILPSWKNYIPIFLCVLIMTLIKFVYFPLILLVFLLPVKKYNKKQILPILILSVLSIFIISLHLKTNFYINDDVYIIDGVNRSEQIRYVFQNPIKFIQVFLNSYIKYGNHTLDGFNGRLLAWGGTVNDKSLGPIIYMFLLFLSPLINTEKLKLTIKDKLILIVIFLIVFAIMFGGIYAEWYPVGAKHVVISGRYFIPIILMILLTYGDNSVIKAKNYKYIYNILLLFIYICSIYNLVGHYI